MTVSAQPDNGLGIERLLDALCPMHAILCRCGQIHHAGPTLAKLAARERPLEGMSIFDLLEPIRPCDAPDLPALLAHSGARLHFALRAPPRTELKGVIMPLPSCPPAARPDAVGAADHAGQPAAVLNLSFGISIVDAVRDFALTGADFAATDLAVEMLYLVEAQSAVMEELRRLNNRLNGARLDAEARATTDMLTGLGNRRAMERALEDVLADESVFSLMHLDLDFFKQVNDRFGHAAGDHVLQVAAQRLLAALRSKDVVIRLGGDEFMLILPGVINPVQVDATAYRLIDTLEKPISFGAERLQISASIGSGICQPHRGMDIEALMREADTALYAAKAAGRRSHRLYTPSLGQIGTRPMMLTHPAGRG